MIGRKRVRESASDQPSDLLSDRSSSPYGSSLSDRTSHCPLTMGVVSPNVVPNLHPKGVGEESYYWVSSIGALNVE